MPFGYGESRGASSSSPSKSVPIRNQSASSGRSIGTSWSGTASRIPTETSRTTSISARERRGRPSGRSASKSVSRDSRPICGNGRSPPTSWTRRCSPRYATTSSQSSRTKRTACAQSASGSRISFGRRRVSRSSPRSSSLGSGLEVYFRILEAVREQLLAIAELAHVDEFVNHVEVDVPPFPRAQVVRRDDQVPVLIADAHVSPLGRDEFHAQRSQRGLRARPEDCPHRGDLLEPMEVVQEPIVLQADVFRDSDVRQLCMGWFHGFPASSERIRRASWLWEPGSTRRYAARIFPSDPITYVTRFATPNRPRALYACAIRLSGSAMRSKFREYFPRNARCDASSWTLTPSTSAPTFRKASESSRNAHASLVQPGVSSSG